MSIFERVKQRLVGVSDRLDEIDRRRQKSKDDSDDEDGSQDSSEQESEGSPQDAGGGQE